MPGATRIGVGSASSSRQRYWALILAAPSVPKARGRKKARPDLLQFVR